MEMLDVVVRGGLEWIYDKVEKRYGMVAAWLVTIALTAAFLGAIAAILIAVL